MTELEVGKEQLNENVMEKYCSGGPRATSPAGLYDAAVLPSLALASVHCQVLRTEAGLFRALQSAHYPFRHHFQKICKSPESTVPPDPTGSGRAWLCSPRAKASLALQGRQSRRRGKSITFISICKAFLCSHVTDRHFAYFQLAIKPCLRGVFLFAPATHCQRRTS